MFSGRSNEPTIWSRIGWLFAEIAVVFIGVYLAFLLEGYRTEQQNEQKKQQAYTALHSYLSAISPNLKRAAQYSDSTYAEPFLKPYKNDEMPRLKPLPFLTLAIDKSTWSAMLQSGTVDLLDVSFILQVNNFFATIDRFRQELTHFNHMQDQYLLPNTDADITTFYNLETKRVKPLYQWYVEYLKSESNFIRTMKRRANNILEDLEQKMSKQQLEKIRADSLIEAQRNSVQKTTPSDRIKVDSTY